MTVISLLFAIAIAVVAVAVAKKGETEVLKSVLLALVVEAEKQYGTGTGQMKLAVVVDWLHQRIPTILKPFFSATDLETLVNAAVIEAKVAWESNKNLENYISE